MLKKSFFAIACMVSLVAADAAHAAGPAGAARVLRGNGDIRHLVMGRRTLAPMAYVKFCVSNPRDCARTGSGEQLVELTPAKRAELMRVNLSVNSSIRPVNDIGNDDEWRADSAQGDCEDFALTKRRHLMSLGWPSGALRMAVAYTGSGEGHAVLVARTSGGDLVLDNRTSRLKDWRKTDLRWVKIQSGEDPRFWHSL